MTRAILNEAIIIASWWRDRGGGALRVRLLQLDGHPCVDVRAWRTSERGVLVPTSSGITTRIKHVEQFAKAFRMASVKATELGPLGNKRPDLFAAGSGPGGT